MAKFVIGDTVECLNTKVKTSKGWEHPAGKIINIMKFSSGNLYEVEHPDIPKGANYFSSKQLRKI